MSVVFETSPSIPQTLAALPCLARALALQATAELVPGGQLDTRDQAHLGASGTAPQTLARTHVLESNGDQMMGVATSLYYVL